jgi:hypothetical protein
MSGALTAADKAVRAVLNRIQRDGRVAYFLGYGSETFDLLIAADAERLGLDPGDYAKAIWENCSPERPQS